MADPVPDPTPTPTPEPTPPPPDPELEKLRQINAQQSRALALAQARVDFPRADAELLEQFQGTGEQIRSFAEKLHAKELARTPNPPPVSVPGPGNSTTAEDQVAARYAELKTKVLVYRNAEPYEREEFSQMAFAQTWNKHQADRKAGRSA
jgi:hypothetical protein